MRRRGGSRTTRVPAAVRCDPVHRASRRQVSIGGLVLLASFSVVSLTACFTGERASIDTSPDAAPTSIVSDSGPDTTLFPVPATAQELVDLLKAR